MAKRVLLVFLIALATTLMACDSEETTIIKGKVIAVNGFHTSSEIYFADGQRIYVGYSVPNLKIGATYEIVLTKTLASGVRKIESIRLIDE